MVSREPPMLRSADLSVRDRWLELTGVVALAFLLTAVIAAPILVAPSQRVFGLEVVGRHHDPFTVMRQFEQPGPMGVYAQPLTDKTGALIARVTGAVAAYNWLVLLTFPLAAAAAFLLARHLDLTPVGATLAALAFAFSPFHLAHAAYHPHIAQVQWVPLYFLALWRGLDKASPTTMATLVLATAAVTFSNFYGGMIAAVMTPFAISAYWLARTRGTTRAARDLSITSATLALIALCGLLFVSWTTPQVLSHPSAFAVAASDPFKYSAKWWSYLVPPLANPWLGTFARGLWHAADVDEGMLEQQVTVGTGVLLLGFAGVLAWLVRRRRAVGDSTAPMLAVVAAIALIWSLSPERTIAGVRIVRPSALLVSLLPMFRSYARFGVVVQLMAVLLAGLGVDALWRAGRTSARVLCVALLLLTVGEYAVAPASMWRDVLPTSAHRWLMNLSGRVRALDCTPLTQESESVQWLTQNRITMSGGALGGCLEPRFAEKLAAHGYTHLLVRADSSSHRWIADHATPEGLRRVANMPDGSVFEVTSTVPAVYTETMDGFSPRETNNAWTWRWMGTDASWTIVNTQTRNAVAALEVEAEAFHTSRTLQLRLDGREVDTLVVGTARGTYVTRSFTVPPGRHTLGLHSLEPPISADSVAHNGDARLLSFAVGTWRWTVRQEPP